ncbi:thiamine phosphate synthase [Plastoroseomonas arctica]|uniref:thiamine phosphate synthase n=1 Tax=Plastoroseomonas arctica TaxID=1509237 RepID=UPI0034621E82
MARRLKPPPGYAALWLVSDPVRLPDPLAAAARLPRGAGVLARGLAPAILAALARLARRRGLVLLVAGDGRAALRHRAGLHLPERGASGLLPFLAARRRGAPFAHLTLAAHGRPAAARARRLRPGMVFLSPAFATDSHPGATALGPLRWALRARRMGTPAAALGGVSAVSAGRLPRRWLRGLAAIGAFAHD